MQRIKIKSIIYDPLWDSLACVRKSGILGNTLLPPGFLASLKVVLIFVNNLGFIRLISCQQTKSFCNVHSFRLCISSRFEGYLPLFVVVLFSFCWHQRKAGCGCEQGTACCAQCQSLLPGCAACERTAESFSGSAFYLGQWLPGPAELLHFLNPFKDSVSHLSHWANRDGNTGLLVEINVWPQNPPAPARQHRHCWEYSFLGCWSGGLWFSFSFFVLSKYLVFVPHYFF